MKKFLSFTYDEPNEKSAPLWEEGFPTDAPAAIYWRPAIGCSAEQYETGQALCAAPGIPWSSINIAEVRVQSRKAYELLNKIPHPDRNFIVRINPPKPEPVFAVKERGVSFFTNGDERELALCIDMIKAAGLGFDSIICSGVVDPNILNLSSHVVFCFRSSSFLDCYADALSANCKILSSNAGAAEEYLARFAEPGTWHVAKKWSLKEWTNMLKDLQGKENEVSQTSIVDQTPYIKTWSDK